MFLYSRFARLNSLVIMYLMIGNVRCLPILLFARVRRNRGDGVLRRGVAAPSRVCAGRVFNQLRLLFNRLIPHAQHLRNLPLLLQRWK